MELKEISEDSLLQQATSTISDVPLFPELTSSSRVKVE
jgi:hypothetical protein